MPSISSDGFRIHFKDKQSNKRFKYESNYNIITKIKRIVNNNTQIPHITLLNSHWPQ